jgi:hypothetical protein
MTSQIRQGWFTTAWKVRGCRKSDYIWRRRTVQVALLSVVLGLLIVGSLYGLWEFCAWVHGR